MSQEQAHPLRPPPGPQTLPAKGELARLLVESVKEYAVLMLDTQGQVVECNEGAVRILGYPPEEIIRQHFSVFFPNGSDQPARELSVATAEGEADDEGWHVRKDGTSFWATGVTTALRDGRGTLLGFGKLLRDVTDRKQSRQALQDTEERFRLLMECVQEYAVIMLDPEGRVVDWNVGAELILGYSLVEIIGQNFSRFFTPEEVAEGVPAQELRTAVTTGRSSDDRWHVRKDGSRFWASGLTTALRDEGGSLRGFVKVMRDHTEAKLAREAFRSLEERHHLITDTVPALIAYIDTEGRYRFNNRAYEVWFHRPLGEITGHHVRDVLGEAVWDTVRPHIEVALAGQEHTREFRLDYPNAEPRWISATYTPYTDRGKVQGVVVLVNDITKRHRAETALRDSEERFRLLVNGVQDHALFLMDPDGQMTMWNEGAERLLGYWAEEVLGQSFAQFFTPEDQRAGMPSKELQTARDIGRARDDNWLIRKDGSRFWASGATTALRDEAGGLRAFVKIVRDLTERRRLEEDLRRQADQLADADRRKNEFLATLAHELRNPLAPIRNALQVMRLSDDPATAEKMRDMIDRQVQQMTHLVDDLLDMTRIARGTIQLRKGHLDLRSVIESAVETSRPLIETAGHELTVTTPESLFVEGDASRLTQVLANVLNNAARYTPNGGHIWLTAGRKDREAEVRVRDTGLGISADVLPRIFDMFTQGDHSSAHSQPGLGIGLTLVKRLVEMHGGSVKAVSDGPGRGSEFTICLPLAPVAPKDDVAPGKREGGQQAMGSAPHRILVVDDNRDAAESLALLLRMSGHEVRLAHDGRQAVAEATAFLPDVVLLDLNLPAMDGFEVARKLRAMPDLMNAVLVTVTGLGQDEDRRRSREAGFDEHWVKPVKPGKVQELLARTKVTPMAEGKTHQMGVERGQRTRRGD